MKIERKLVIGQNEYTVTVDAESAADFFKTMSFFDSLPKVGPNGETDLVLSYRTPQNYEYYSIISLQAEQEFKFGQHKERPGSLFAKGWEPLFKGDNQEESVAVTSGVGLGAPVVMPTPAQAPVAKTASTTGLGVAPKPATATPPKTAAPTAAPAVQNQAAAILSKFGI